METKLVNRVPPWARGTFIWRCNLPDGADALEQAAVAIEKVQNLLDREVRSVVTTSGAIGLDTGFQNWDGPWPYFNRPSYRIGHDWKNLARFMVKMRDEQNAWIGFHTNITDVNVGLRCHPEMQAYFEKLRAAGAIYTREGGGCGVPARGAAYVPDKIPFETAKMEYVSAGDPSDIFAIVNYKKMWDSGIAREMLDEFFSHLPYPPLVLYVDVLSTTGNNLNVGFPDGFLGGSEATQEEGRKNILDHIRSKGTEPGGEGPMTCTWYNWNHGGMSANDYSRIETGFAQGCYWQRGAEWQHVYGNIGAYSLDMEGKLRAKTIEYVALKGGGTMMVGAAEGRVAAQNETDEWRTMAEVIDGFYLTTIQELYHTGLGNVRLPGGPGTERLDEHRGRAMLDRIDLYTQDRRHLAGAQADEGQLTAPCEVVEWPTATKQKVVGSFDVSLKGCARLELSVPDSAAGNAVLLVRYASPLGGSLQVDVNGQSLGEIDLPATGRPANLGDLAIPVKVKAGTNVVEFRKGSIHTEWSDGTQAKWDRDGFRAWNGDVTFGVGYHRMWPDTWSGTKKIHFYSREGGERTWTLPESWKDHRQVRLYTLTESGRTEPLDLQVNKRQVKVPLKPRQPAILVPLPA